MRRTTTLALALITLGAALPVAAQSGAGPTSKISPLGAGANSVAIIPWGYYFHRPDHLLFSEAEFVTPEEADRRNYLPDPECLPPTTSKLAAEETASGHRKLNDFYKALLEERENPTTNQAPVGQLPRSGAAGRTAATGGGGSAFAATASPVSAAAPAAAAPAAAAPAAAPTGMSFGSPSSY